MSLRRQTIFVPLLLLIACQSEPEPMDYLHVTSLSDGERVEIFERFSPLIQAGLGGASIQVGQPIAVKPPGHGKSAEPGPVVWEVQMTAVDTLSGEGYSIRLSKDSNDFVVEALEGVPHLESSEAARAMRISNADDDVMAIVNRARGAGYVVSPGAMALEGSETCPGRCVDVRYVGVRHRADGGHDTANMVNAQISLGSEKVVSFTEPAWLP